MLAKLDLSLDKGMLEVNLIPTDAKKKRAMLMKVMAIKLCRKFYIIEDSNLKLVSYLAE